MKYEKIYFVDEDDTEKRIDKYLADYETEHSRTYIQKLNHQAQHKCYPIKYN